MQLRVITPDEELFSGEVTSVTIPGEKGQLQVLPGHTYLLSLTCSGRLDFVTAQGEQHFDVAEGHAEVLDDVVTVAVDKVQ
jgi:F-type H+-transporting ATPase subunit epsilon